MSTFQKLVALADEAPWCGTKPPGVRPGPKELEALQIQSLPGPAQVEWPVPNPWYYSSITNAAFWQSVRLCQIGQRLKDVGQKNETAIKLGDNLTNAAEDFFEGQCGNIPIWVLIGWLIHPPPPPPPWESTIIDAAGNIELGIKIGGEIGGQIQRAAAATIRENLPTQGAS